MVRKMFEPLKFERSSVLNCFLFEVYFARLMLKFIKMYNPDNAAEDFCLRCSDWGGCLRIFFSLLFFLFIYFLFFIIFFLLFIFFSTFFIVLFHQENMPI